MKKNTVLWVAPFLMAATAFGQSPSATPQRGAGPVVSRADTATRDGQNVLFATNDDCELFINGQPRGSVSKAEFKYLKLAPGTYRYTARSRRTGDEWNDTFTVSGSGENEVFMDLLYVIDQNAAQRQATVRTGLSSTTPTKASGKKSSKTAVLPAITKPEASKAAIEAVINLLSTNTVLLEGGAFVMGNNRSSAPDESEHNVLLKSVFIGKYEVTQHQWETIMGFNPSVNKNCQTCPVDNVSWEEAMNFVQKLNAVSGKKFRLPTEAEWEYASKINGRAAVEQAGGQESFIKKTAWFFSNAGGKPHPVGLLEANGAGLFDLTGNVSEWCLDWYAPDFYTTEFSRNSPEGPTLGKEKIVRGGNFKDYVGDRFRPSFRGKRQPTYKGGEVGFRLVLEPADQ